MSPLRRLADRPRATLVAALLISLLLHGGLWGLSLLSVVAALLPKPPIEFELIPRKTSLPGSEPPAPPPPVAAPPAEKGLPTPSVTRDRKRRPAPVDPLPLAPRLDPSAPVVLALLRLDRLATSPHRKAAGDLLEAFPDARLLAQGSALAPPGALSAALIESGRSLLVTTSDPRRLTATALLIDLTAEDSDLLGKLAGRTPQPWDDRQVVSLSPARIGYGDDEALRHFQKLPKEALPSEPGVALLLLGDNLDRLITLRDLPTPRRLRLTVTAEPQPDVRLTIDMPDPAQARAVAEALPALRDRLTDQLAWLGLRALLSDLAIERKGARVQVKGRLPRADTGLALSYLALLLSRIPLPVVTPDLGAGSPADLGPGAPAAPGQPAAPGAPAAPRPPADLGLAPAAPGAQADP